MGARGSTPRTVSLDNDTPIGVIDVSDDVVNRLKGLHVQARKEQREHDREVAELALAAAELKYQPEKPTGPTQQVVVYGGDSTITALEVRRQKELELRENDLYWQKRLHQQEESLRQTVAILASEYNKTHEELRQQLEQASANYQLPPCRDYKEKIIDCYKANAGQPLNCASIVADFTDCVQQHQNKLLNEKYSEQAKPVRNLVVAS